MFRIEKKKLQDTLRSIEEKSSSLDEEPHTGQSGCPCCNAKNQKILQAYENYFFSPDPTTWYAELPEYKPAMQARFKNIKNPIKQDLKDLHSISSAMLYDYILASARDINININIEQSSPGIEKKTERIPIQQLIEKFYDALITNSPSADAQNLISSLQETKTATERAPLYIQYYCAPSANDTLQQRNFKAKYARIFETNSTHDEVLRAMRKEAQELNIEKINALHKELGELQLAQSAHLKNKAKKAEKNQRIRDRDQSPKAMCCSLDKCKKELDPSKENIECAICEWIDSKGGGKGRLFYCSIEHAEEDFVKLSLMQQIWADFKRLTMIVKSTNALPEIDAFTIPKLVHQARQLLGEFVYHVYKVEKVYSISAQPSAITTIL